MQQQIQRIGIFCRRLHFVFVFFLKKKKKRDELKQNDGFRIPEAWDP